MYYIINPLVRVRVDNPYLRTGESQDWLSHYMHRLPEFPLKKGTVRIFDCFFLMIQCTYS